MSARFTDPSQGRILTRSLEVGQYGVAFTFTEKRWAGQYANGDWWVLGPVTFTEIAPASFVQASGVGNAGATPYTNRTVHGTMLNPGNRVFATGGLIANNAANSAQGWDSLQALPGAGAPQAFNDAFNVDPGSKGPLTVSTGSVVKFVSKLTDLPARNAPLGLDMVVLTVVDAFPAPDAIRPGVSSAGNKASRLRLSDFNLGAFQNLPAPASTPAFETTLARIARYLETSLPATIQNASHKGINNQDWYARETAWALNYALLSLHVDALTADQKLRLIAPIATFGEDVITRAEEGSVIEPDGGPTGHKVAPLAVLAAALGAKVPAAWSFYLAEAQRPVWAEWREHPKVVPFDVAQPRQSIQGRPTSAYTLGMIGSVDWIGGAPSDATVAQKNSVWDGRPNNLAYRDNTATSSILPGMLAIELTAGARTLWDYEDRWLYYASAYANRDVAGNSINALQPFFRAMLESYRAPIAAAPVVVEAGARDSEIWLRCSLSLNDTADATPQPSGFAPPPDPSAFAVLVNGVARSVTAVRIWRQNVGLTLASPVTGGDVVTVSYTVPGANPVRSVDGVNLASFAGLAVTNRADRNGGTNTAFPVVRFAPGVTRRTTLDAAVAPANGSFGTLALLRFRFPALPAANVIIQGAPSGSPGMSIQLLTSGRLLFTFVNAAGTAIASIQTPALAANVYYDILLSLDLTQATNTAGANSFINGSAATLTFSSWSGGAGVVVGWSRQSTTGLILNRSGFTFDMGALWIDATTRVDITSPTERAKFAPAAIGSRGDGVTGSIPALFLVGNAAQWNDDFGVQRGSGNARMFPTLGNKINAVAPMGTITAASTDQQVWGVTPPPVAANISAAAAVNSSNRAIALQPSGIWTSVEIVTAPTNGSVSLAGTTAFYTPTTAFTGIDSFTYRAIGPGGASAPATVTVNVTSIVTADSTLVTADSTLFRADRTN